jgi:hypothetical protein
VRTAGGVNAGLCASCMHAETIRGAASTFLLCGLSRSDHRFARYPVLPVIRCVGFRERTESFDDGTGDDTDEDLV